MSDTNERSAASDGSVSEPRNGAPSGCETVRSEPVPLAWAVIGSGETEGHVAGLHYTRLEAEMRIARMNEVGDCARARTMLVVPLYRHACPRVVRLPKAPDDLEISEANGYATALEDFTRALADAGIWWKD
jgi:hypothetical protein